MLGHARDGLTRAPKSSLAPTITLAADRKIRFLSSVRARFPVVHEAQMKERCLDIPFSLQETPPVEEWFCVHTKP